MDDDQNDEIDINLRLPAEVAGRVALLGAVCRRAYLELLPPDAPDTDDPEAERFDLAAWVRTEGLDALATPTERHLLQTRIGRLTPDEAETITWQTEGLAVLCWALGLIADVPPYDQPIDPTAVLRLIPTPWESTATFRRSTPLRPEADIAAERERAELWFWRAETADLLIAATGREATDISRVIRDVARDAAAAGHFPAPIGHDFPARGLPYRDLDEATHAVIATIAAERHRALGWLCGFGSDWDHVPTEV